MIIGIQDEILRIHSLGLLDRLLADKTTKGNIIWATDAYSHLGAGYQREQEICPPLITGENSGIIKNRARKALEQQSARTRQHGEVATPFWVCAKMNDYADEVWFGRPDVFARDGEPTERVLFPKNKHWQRYVDSRRLEITCGEAPYLVSRYDVSTGESIPLARRTGILDRKLRVVNENTTTEEEWLQWALRAFRATYGYELQGDNLLISRVNLLATFEEYLAARWGRKPTKQEYATVTNIIAWNIWQMDGLTAALPYAKTTENYNQISIEDILGMNEDDHPPNTEASCRLMNWTGGRSVGFAELQTRGNHGMKFDFIIGNPPYQEEVQNKGDRPNPIYDKFIEGAYGISDAVMLIHPARFLFNAGQTPKAWNKKMLSDEHLRVIFYEPDASKIFQNTEIKGGVSITLRNTKKNYGAIGTFTSYPELNHIVQRISNYTGTAPRLDTIISSQGLFRFSDKFFEEHPEATNSIGTGTGSKIVSSVMEKLPNVFLDTPTQDGENIRFLGRVNNQRIYKYIPRRYLVENIFMDKYKAFTPEANSSGQYGEILTTAAVGYPMEGCADTFLCVGPFDSKNEPENFIKYMRTKLFRALLGVKKVTQHCPPIVWSMIPLQDFSPASDIDWSKSISEIDRQLYAKYGLNEAEIAFIESHVKEMK